jgi:hypothetical protein
MSEEPIKIIEQSAISYADNIVFRTLIQSVPWIGAPLDTLLSGTGSKIQNKRMQHFLEELSQRMEQLEKKPTIDEEELFNLAIDAMDKSVRASTDQKRQLFAQIMARQIAERGPYEEAEMALRIVSELDSVHIHILTTAIDVPVILVGPVQEDDQEKNEELPILTKLLSEYPAEVIQLAVAELISKSLLHDEGVSQYGGQPMYRVSVSNTAHWLKRWLSF